MGGAVGVYLSGECFESDPGTIGPARRRDGLWGETHHGGANGRHGDASGSHDFGCNDVRRSGRTLRTVAHVPRFCGGALDLSDSPVWGTRLFITQELRKVSRKSPDLGNEVRSQSQTSKRSD